ncbi:uncharacterized protein LOC119228629 isoform X1 [Pungitius pungitius]|uniref:uncharacterized protein LOC119228629 isoform X1 n=1 Tax=Pungitius pungitius TaxID=134920 RepID=UPI002E146199
MHGVKSLEQTEARLWNPFLMYLENSEQSEVSGDGGLSAGAMLAEQCPVPSLTEAVDLSGPLKGSAELGMQVFVEFTEQTVSKEMDSSIVCLDICNRGRDETASCTYCNGHCERFEQYPESDRFFDSDQILDQCETPGLSQAFEKCAHHCVSFKPRKSSAHSANHSLASECSCCCEQCAGRLLLFQQRNPSDQQFESFDSEPALVAVDCEGLGQCEMSDFVPDCTGLDHLGLLQQYEPSDQQYECSDSEPDTSTEDSEQCETTIFTRSISNSMDLLDCGAELYEYDECTKEDGGESCPTEGEGEQSDIEPIDDESLTLSQDANTSQFDRPVRVYFEDRKEVPSASDCCETHQLAEENLAQALSTEDCVVWGTAYSDTSQERDEESATPEQSEFGEEEEDSSDCSSIETKSFKTCPDGSIASDHCSDSSGESEQAAQEDSTDEHTQWESFEDDDETLQSDIDGSDEGEKKTPAADSVVEDFFDLFDSGDFYGRAFAQKQHYISCFDGGDIHDRLHLEDDRRKAQTLAEKNAFESEEVSEDIHVQETDACLDALEEAYEDTWEEDTSQRGVASFESDDDSGLAGDEVEENESQLHTEEDENPPFDSHVSEIDTEEKEEEEDDKEEAELCLFSVKESSSSPCAGEISVEDDAYEDEAFAARHYESLQVNTATTNDLLATVSEPEDQALDACSELEPYWSLVDQEGDGETFELSVEEYYANQIKSIQSSVKQALNGFILQRTLCDHVIHRDASEECKEVQFGITKVITLRDDSANGSVGEKATEEKAPESACDREFSDVSIAINPTLDIIHSVVSQLTKNEGRVVPTLVRRPEGNEASEEGVDSEEEQSDDESTEPCQCEYCLPPIQELPAKPLLPQLKLNDAGKICVVIDLDETLVHSSFKPVNNADFIIPVEIDGTVHQVYVLKRPHVDEFLRRMGELFECVLFTASLAKYADPVSDLLDKWGAFQSRLFRESCVFHKGNYVKDLSRLGRDLNKVIIIDNSPASYVFHPQNAVPVASWFDDMSDTELLDLIPFFERLSKVEDIYDVLQQHQMTSS